MSEDIILDATYFAQRDSDLALMEANVFTNEHGALNNHQLKEWLAGNRVQSDTQLGLLTIQSGVDRYGQHYWLATQPDGLHFATIPPVPVELIKSKIFDSQAMAEFSEKKGIQFSGESDFGGFRILFGYDQDYSDFLIIRTEEQGFMLYVDWAKS